MAGPTPKGRRFQKGQSGNPRGSSARVRQLKEVAALTNAQVAEVGSVILLGNRESLQAIGNNPDATVLQIWIAGLVVKSLKEGDAAIFNAIMSRLLGKPKETLEHTGPDGKAIQTERVTMTYEQKLARLETLRSQRLLVSGGDETK